MTDHVYRFSIIPGGAVTDRRLEGRDLQVLALLGRHSRNGGWVFRSQVKMAKELDCGRGTIQRSLDRLIEAGWVERRARGRGEAMPDDSKQPFAAYAYRAIFDNVVPEEYFSTIEDEEINDDNSPGGCPPVGTGAQPGGHPGAQPCVGTIEGTTSESDGHDARARPAISETAFELAEQIAVISGYPDVTAWPPDWCGAPHRAQMMLDHGWRPEVMLAEAKAVMARKRDGPPRSITYFERPFAVAHARQSAPLPTVVLTDQKPEIIHGSSSRPDKGRSGLDAIDRVFDRVAEVRRRDAAQLHEDVVPRLSTRPVPGS